MPVFKLKCDQKYETWYRDYYEIQANTQEEAVQIILEGDVEPYDSIILPDLMAEPIKTEILDENYEVVYVSK